MKFFVALVVLTMSASSYAGAAIGIAELKNSKLTFDGLGPLRIGMTLKAVQAAGIALEMDGDASNPCRTARLKVNQEISLMFEKGILTLVEISGPSISTHGGIRVGFTEAQIREVYGSRVVVAPYDGGHYMKIFSLDGKRALVFETYGAKVNNFRSGDLVDAQLSEGCS